VRTDFGMGEGAVGHDFGGAQLVAAMDEIDFGGEAGEEHGFFAGGIAAADDADRDIAIERAVAGGAGGESMPDEFFFAVEIEPAGGGTAGDDQCASIDPGIIELDCDKTVAGLDFLELRVLKPGTEALGLLFHAHDEHGAVDAFREAGEVFNEGGGGELTTGLGAFEDEGCEVCACAVDGGSESGATGSDDDNIFHEASIVALVWWDATLARKNHRGRCGSRLE